MFPFYIEDFRITPLGERREGDNLSRINPLLHLAEEFLNQEIAMRGQFLRTEICDATPGTPNAVFNNVIPVDWVYQPLQVHVGDDNAYYIRDAYWTCEDLSTIPRVSKWSPEGELLGMVPLARTANPTYGPPLGGDAFIPHHLTPFTLGGDGRFWFGFRPEFSTFGASQVFYSIDTDLGDPRYHGGGGYTETETINGAGVITVAGSNTLGLMFELHSVAGNPFDPPDFFGRFETAIHVRPVATDTRLDENLDKIGIMSAGAEAPLMSGEDIEMDSEGNVYVLDRIASRVHKFSAPFRDADNNWQLGEYIGWMGRCSANRLNENGVPFNACDETTRRSLGYALYRP